MSEAVEYKDMSEVAAQRARPHAEGGASAEALPSGKLPSVEAAVGSLATRYSGRPEATRSHADDGEDDEFGGQSSQKVAKEDLDAQGPSADLVRVYLNGIGKTALLTAEQEINLSKRIEAGLLAERVLAVRKNPDAIHAVASSIYEAKTTKYKQLAKQDPEAAEQKMTTETSDEIALMSELVDADRLYTDKDLSMLVRDGGRARNHLLVANLRLVVSLAKRYTGRGMPLLDLIQEGNLGLIRAVEKFDYQKGFKFSTYATWWIRQAISRGMADQGKTIRLPVHLVEQVNKVARFKRELHQQLGRDPTNAELAHESGIAEEKIQELLDHGRDPISLDMNVGDDGDSRLGDFIEDTDATSADAAVTASFMHNDINKVLGTLDDREQTVVRLRYGLDDGRPRTLDEIGRHFGLSRERVRQIEREAMVKMRTPKRSGILKPYTSS